MTRARATALGCALTAGVLTAGVLTASAVPGELRSSFVIETDPRVELLGVVQYLADRRDNRVPLPVPYGKEIERHFGRFRGNAAVKLYKELADKYQDFGVDILFLSNPPALRPADSSRPPPFGGGAADFEGFLEALRLFSVESDFAGFYAGHRETYRDFETTARHEAGRRDFPGVVENYVGRNLESRCHYLLALSYAAKSGASYIIPYPNAELGTAAHGPYDVYVLLTPEILDERPSFFGAYRGMLLDELIYVFIERTYFPYMKAHAAEESALLGALGSACRDRDCLKDALVRAIGQRLRAAVCSEGMRCNEKRLKKTDAVAGLFAGRLAEYEGARDRYPALDDFYPRLFSAPPEIARPASSSVTAP